MPGELFGHQAFGGDLLLLEESRKLEDSGLLQDLPKISTGLDQTTPVTLWQRELEVFGRLLPPHHQALQDCTGHAWAKALEDWILQEPGDWCGELSTEVLYGGSRIQIGAGRAKSSGSCCAWVASFLIRFGFLPRGVYGQHDLRLYRADLTKQFGLTGVPGDLLSSLYRLEAKFPNRQFRVGRLRTGQDAWQAIGARYALPFACRTGFQLVRGPGGVCAPSGEWNHAMVIRGRFVLQDGRYCVAVQNSMGRYLGTQNCLVEAVGVEKPVTLPDGVFLMELDVLDQIARQEDLYVVF